MSKNFELLQQTSNAEDLFRTSGDPRDRTATADSKPTPVQGKEFQPRMSKHSLLPVRWLDLVKEGAGNWGRQIPAGNNGRRSGLEAVTREEEIKLVQRLFLAAGQRSPQVVLFSGVDSEAASCSICARASEILAAQVEGPVCVVDAGLRSPSLHRYFGVENCKGFAEAVLESGPIQDFVRQLSECNLWVMPSGFAAPQLSLRQVSDRLKSRMTELRNAFRHVVIQAPPLNLDSDSILLSRWTDGVVLVVEANTTRRETARRVKENLQEAQVSVLGVVLNNRTFPIPETLYRKI